MGKALAQIGGNDRVMTPLSLCKEIVEHFKPRGKILEPCCGKGNFLKVLPGADWCEIDKGVDFLRTSGNWDWIVTNPPYSKYREFLKKSMKVATNVVFLQLINATFYSGRLKDIRDMGFGIKEIWLIKTPRTFPQFGFQMGCVHYKLGHNAGIKFDIGERHLRWW